MVTLRWRRRREQRRNVGHVSALEAVRRRAKRLLDQVVKAVHHELLDVVEASRGSAPVEERTARPSHLNEHVLHARVRVRKRVALGVAVARLHAVRLRVLATHRPDDHREQVARALHR